MNTTEEMEALAQTRKSLTIQEAKVVLLIRQLNYGQMIIHLEAHKITHVERKESVKV